MVSEAHNEVSRAEHQRTPSTALYIYRFLRRLRREVPHLLRFIFLDPPPGTTLGWRIWFVARLYRISLSIDAQHNQVEILRLAESVLRLPPDTPGCLVEAGSYKGASAAKLSLVAAQTGRRLYVFDSFEGIPVNAEPARENIYGNVLSFPPGSYAGSLEEVRGAVSRFGVPAVCEFVKGWFDDTMPNFHQPVVLAFIDVDLASSTRTCLRQLWPLLAPGSSAFSHDGGLPAVTDLLADERFWKDELGCEKPQMPGLGRMRLVQIIKPR